MIEMLERWTGVYGRGLVRDTRKADRLLGRHIKGVGKGLWEMVAVEVRFLDPHTYPFHYLRADSFHVLARPSGSTAPE